MYVDLCRAGRFEDTLSLRCLVRCTVGNNEELVRFERSFVQNTAVLGNADAEQRGGQRTQTANNNGAFQCSDNPTHQRAKHDEGTDARDNEKGRAEQQTPEAAPKSAQFSPYLHTVTGVIVADDMFLS